MGLSSGQVPILLALAESEPLSQKAFVERAAIAQPVIAATLRRMEKLRLIRRRTDPWDRRSTLFSLTVRGRRKLGRLYAALKAGNATALEGMTSAEAELFIAFLGRVIANITAAEKEDARRRRG